MSAREEEDEDRRQQDGHGKAAECQPETDKERETRYSKVLEAYDPKTKYNVLLHDMSLQAIASLASCLGLISILVPTFLSLFVSLSLRL